MTILVTGGVGFIGTNFILDWVKLCDEPIVNLDKLTYAGNPENLRHLMHDSRYTFIQADIGDIAQVLTLLKLHKVRAVINFAAESHVDNSILAPELFVQTNIVGTFRLLQAVLSYWNELTNIDKMSFRFLHISTDEVYGSLTEGAPPFTEISPIVPSSPYSASKAASDHLVHAFHKTYGLPVLRTNCSNNYGPYQFPEKLIPRVISNALVGKQLPIYGDGSNVRDWLYVLDHCAAIRRVLEFGSVGEVYNIGGWSERTNLQVVHTVCELLDTRQPDPQGSYLRLITYVKDRLGHDRRYAVDATKIQQQLDWRPSETFESGIAKTVTWYLQNQAWLANTASRTVGSSITQKDDIYDKS